MRPRVQKVEEKVLKIDRPLAGGFSGLTALWAEGCGIALSGDEHEVSVTFLSFASPVSITKCKSPLPQAEVLQRTSEPG